MTVRAVCWKCHRIESMCLCSQIQKFETEPLIVLLVHSREHKKSVGTVHIVKLSIQNSIVIRGRGSDFDSDPAFASLLEDPTLYPVVLYPSSQSVNLSSPEEVQSLKIKAQNKRLAFIVIDGTWALATKMIGLSRKIQSLPQVSFDVTRTSNYRFRRQPNPKCLSTVEATHLLIETLNHAGLARLPIDNRHNQMLKVFDVMVESQLESAKKQALRI